MSITLTKPELTELKPKIVVLGVGGAGGNAVNNMIRSELQGIEFIVANTDAQALSQSLTDRRLQLGVELTHGLGAGARPEIGEQAAREAGEYIDQELEGCHMAFITAGMGGGTGTGAAPVIANQARERGILTVGVVTKPFQFEGSRRMNLAEQGIEELQQAVDTLIVIPNQNLFRIANEKTTFADAFAMADRVLHSGVRGITDLMVMPGLINLDFADVRTVMMEMGKAMMGTGEAEGEKRALEAAESAIANPLLDDVSLKGAKGVLINITGGTDMTLFEVDEAANRIRSEVDPDANIIVGSTFDEELSGKLRVSVFATGIESEARAAEAPMALHTAETRRTASETRVTAATRENQQSGEVIAMPQQRMAGAGDAAAATATTAVAESAPTTAPEGSPGEPDIAQNDDTPMTDPASAESAPETEPATGDERPQPETPAARTDTPFIAPRPMRADGSEAPASGDPFAEAAMANAHSESESGSQKGPSLLDRVTGRARKSAPVERKEPDIGKPKAAPKSEVPKTERKNADMTFQFGESGENQQDRTGRDGEEDQLEIPAFLRRQAN